MISIFEIFRIGIGPSSSHTVGPMRIAKRFVDELLRRQLADRVGRIYIELQGSLALTGSGHGTPSAVIMGLLGLEPETIDIAAAKAQVERVSASKTLAIAPGLSIGFVADRDLKFAFDLVPELHPNGIKLVAFDAGGGMLLDETYYSTGGGFIASRLELENTSLRIKPVLGEKVPFPFASGEELLLMCAAHNMTIHDVVRANEDAMRPAKETDEKVDRVADAMNMCIERGLCQEGELPGHLRVSRRAPAIWRKLRNQKLSNEREQLFDWINVYAMAVNEENAAGGQVVTAPTNGAAGIVPALIRYYCSEASNFRKLTREFLLTAGGIGLLYKKRASISGAEMGCQGEVGVACSMAAAGLAAVWGGSPQQVANAAEIGMEHNLGLTCDPVGGLVQIPCIERNAIGAVKAVNAARLALHGSGRTKVSLDQVIETMRQTGLDMSTKYKETSLGGLAVNVVEC